MEQGRTLNNMIECRGVSKAFDNNGAHTDVVAHVDLAISENEFVVLLGPGQCGKTTLVNLAAGLETADQGEIRVAGQKVDRPGPDRGVVFQTTNLFPWLTVMGNVEYGLKMAGLPRQERRRRAQRYIDLVGLQGFEGAFPIQLSGGMQQRVGIARAYCIEPKVMLMDEPFSALDAQTRYQMQEELVRIWEAEKRTVVFVTNNIEEAIYLADRIILLSNCPAEIRREYRVEMPRPRNYTSREFLALRKEITAVMECTL